MRKVFGKQRLIRRSADPIALTLTNPRANLRSWIWYGRNTGCAINSTHATWRAIKPIIGEYLEISVSVRARAHAAGESLLDAVLWTFRWRRTSCDKSSCVNSIRTVMSSYTGPFNDKYSRIRGIIGVQRSRTV